MSSLLVELTILAALTVVSAGVAAMWWPSLSGTLKGPGGRALVGALWGVVWGVFVARFGPVAAESHLPVHIGLLAAGVWLAGLWLWGYRSTYLWMVAVNLPLGLLHWPTFFLLAFAALMGGQGQVHVADSVLLGLLAVGLWVGALHLMVVGRQRSLPPARRRNVQRLYAWLSHTPVWPPPPMPEELPPTEIMEDIEGGWDRFLEQQSNGFAASR